MANVQHLVCFVQTAEHGSFSAAARVLGLTPAGVSKNVARLESALGLRLSTAARGALRSPSGANACCSR